MKFCRKLFATKAQHSSHIFLPSVQICKFGLQFLLKQLCSIMQYYNVIHQTLNIQYIYCTLSVPLYLYGLVHYFPLFIKFSTLIGIVKPPFKHTSTFLGSPFPYYEIFWLIKVGHFKKLFQDAETWNMNSEGVGGEVLRLLTYVSFNK